MASSLLHLDQPLEDEDATLGERIEEPAETSPDEALERREMRGMLATAVRNLPDVQAEVISRYYVDGDLLQTIADDLGLTEARVSQIRSEALAALRAFFATQYEDVDFDVADAPGKRSRAAYLERMSQQADWRDRVDAAELLDAASAGLVSLIAAVRESD